MVGGPIEFVVAIAIVDGVLRLIPSGVDECERLAQDRILPAYRTYPEDWLPGLRSGIEGTGNSGCILSECEKVQKPPARRLNAKARQKYISSRSKNPVSSKNLRNFPHCSGETPRRSPDMRRFPETISLQRGQPGSGACRNSQHIAAEPMRGLVSSRTRPEDSP